MSMPTTVKRLPFVAALLALLAGAWLQVEAAPVQDASSWRHQRAQTPTASGITTVWIDVDQDGDLDVVGIDGALALLVWENDGAGRLSLRQPLTPTLWSSTQEDAGLDSPCATDTSDQSDTPSVGLARRCAPIVSQHSRPLTADVQAALRSRTRSSRSPRAPPVLLRTT